MDRIFPENPDTEFLRQISYPPPQRLSSYYLWRGVVTTEPAQNAGNRYTLMTDTTPRYPGQSCSINNVHQALIIVNLRPIRGR